MSFKVLKQVKDISIFEDLEKIHSLLREEYTSQKIEIIYTDTKKYNITVYDTPETNFTKEIEISANLDVVYGDTDSIMIRIKFNRTDWIKNRQDSFKLGIECAKILTDDVFNRHPIEMEMENIYNPFIMLTRKRYTAKKYEDVKDVTKSKGVITKGLATTRRDYSPLIQKCLRDIIDAIMKTEGKPEMKEIIVKQSIDIYRNTLRQIERYDVSMEDIVTSSTLKKNYKNPNLPHVNLYHKMLARKEDIQIGDRIQFVFIEDVTNTNKAKNELSECPKFVKANNLKINRLFYTEKLAKVILGFYKHLLIQDQLNEILDFTNTFIEKYNGKALRPKDFITDD